MTYHLLCGAGQLFQTSSRKLIQPYTHQVVNMFPIELHQRVNMVV